MTDGQPTPRVAQLGTDGAPSQVSGEKRCERCGCCAMRWEECTDCEGKGRYDILGEDAASGLYRDGWRQCSKCEGCGGWWLCGCNDKGQHAEKTP